ncbi:MAG: S-adenosylmethionine:tRNA ribosyltransferase-isomerase [Tannerella sp.]|jgi:S-adenosylmethionine:tRNA ribosyltransferase-isomerase|nr:S-adenosylmethionine:tRNA ribosyltransferase-isomerase [Tannerella sp.]
MPENFNNVQDINIQQFDYQLPDDSIAKFPLERRDMSKLLVYRGGEISEHVFKDLSQLLPTGSLLVFNNTRVIRARLPFTKDTGAKIEVFCLEPDEPNDYAVNFATRGECRWKCLIGNQKRWKSGELKKNIIIKGNEVTLTATQHSTVTITFRWSNADYTFADILEAGGVIPIPPYLNRATQESDLQTYQTIYSKIKGSVAAPTAGLHFTDEVLQDLKDKGIKTEELTLHVGAGTFKPVQTDRIGDHAMHAEFFTVSRRLLEALKQHAGNITAVGTTSVRTLESLYFLGTQLETPDCCVPTDDLQGIRHCEERSNPALRFSLDCFVPRNDVRPATSAIPTVSQWSPYDTSTPEISTEKALQNLIDYCDRNNLDAITASTQIIIVPGFRFRIINRMLTNFHQPKSTLMLLVAAFTGTEDIHKIYDYALTHDFRFLSYGDTSLLTH